MSKDLNIKQLSDSAKQIGSFAKKYAGFSFLITVLCIYSFLVFRISTLAKSEPTDDQVNEQIAITKRLKIDQNSIDKILQLEDQNVGVQSLFETARENPFEDQ